MQATPCLLYNLIFEANGIRSCREYIYGIGEGKLQRHSNSGTVASDSMKLDVLQQFTSRQSSGTVSVVEQEPNPVRIFSRVTSQAVC